jgi:hypothetical protein
MDVRQQVCELLESLTAPPVPLERIGHRQRQRRRTGLPRSYVQHAGGQSRVHGRGVVGFRLVGFVYPLTGTVRINETPPGSVASYTAAAQSDPVPPVTGGQVDSRWQNVTSAHDQVAIVTLTSGPGGVINATFGAAGDCYELLSGQGSAGSAASACAPVSTPQGQEAMRLEWVAATGRVAARTTAAPVRVRAVPALGLAIPALGVEDLP